MADIFNFTTVQLWTLEDFLGACTKRWASMMTALLRRNTGFTLRDIEPMKTTGILPPKEVPYISVGTEFTKGVSGKSLMIFEGYAALVITDILMGGKGRIDLDKSNSLSLRNAHFSAMSELTHHMLSYAADIMAEKQKQNIMVPALITEQVSSDLLNTITGFSQESSPVIKITYNMEIEDLLKCGLTQFITADLAKAMINGAD